MKKVTKNLKSDKNLTKEENLEERDPASQARRYCITINNPEKHGLTRENILDQLFDLKLIYFCLADEISPTHHTEHTHIYLCAKGGLRFSTLKRSFPAAHIEVARKSGRENRDYILKMGKWEGTDKALTSVEGTFFEHGELPVERESKKTFYELILREIDAGSTNEEILRKYPNALPRLRDIVFCRNELMRERREDIMRDVHITYLFGDLGTPKLGVLYKRHDAKDICRIVLSTPNKDILFDDYVAQDILIFENFSSQIPLETLISYLSGYPLALHARYSNRTACYTHVYLLANEPIESQYCHEQAKNSNAWKAFLSCISSIEECLPDGTINIIKEAHHE